MLNATRSAYEFTFTKNATFLASGVHYSSKWDNEGKPVIRTRIKQKRVSIGINEQTWALV